MGKPLDGAISTTNYARNAPVAATSFNASAASNSTVSGYPSSNATSPERGREWRVGGWNNLGAGTGDRAAARITIDCERAVDPQTFALISSNAKQGTVRLYGSDDAACSQNVIAYDIDLYDAPGSGLVVGYPNKRRVRVVDPEELGRYSNASATAVSSAFDTLGNNVRGYSDLCRLNPGYHVYTGNDFSADDIEYVSTLGAMSTYRSRSGTSDPQSKWYSYLYWPGAAGGSGHWVNTRYKSWPGSGRSATGLPGYSVPLAMPAQFMGYKNTQWVTDPSANVVESTTAQHGYVSSTRADGNASSVLGASDNSSWKSSTSRIVVEQTFRLREVYDSGRWALVGWSTNSDTSAGLEYVKHGSDPDLSYFNLRVWPVDEDAANTAQFIVPESKILDGNFHTISVAYRGVAGASTYGIILDGEYITNTMISASVDDTANPYLTYTVGFWGNGGALSDVVDLAGAVVSTAYAGWSDGNNEAWTAAKNLDLQARMRYGIGTSSEDFKREFWTVDFDAVNNYGITGSELRVGGIWIGNRIDVSSDESGTDLHDASRMITSQTSGGSIAVTQRPGAKEAAVSVSNLSLSRADDIANSVSCECDAEILVDVLHNTDEAANKDSGSVYGYLTGPASKVLSHGETSKVAFKVKESL